MTTEVSEQKSQGVGSVATRWLAVIGVIGAVVVAASLRNQWLPTALRLIAGVTTSETQSVPTPNGTAHAVSVDDHGHAHEGHDETNSLQLSPQAQKNVGLTTAVVKLQPFVRTVSMPATVIGRPGRSQVEVTASLGGRVMRVYSVEGEAVEPGQPLFDLRLTHEDLVKAQSEFLRSAEELDVELREIDRLKSAGGAIPLKTLRQREYEKQKLDAMLNSQQQSLLLHGLTQEQIDAILESRKLVQGVTVNAPDHLTSKQEGAPRHPFTVRSLHAKTGQYVDAGDPLCLLMDYSELFLQGRAFEHDADELLLATRNGWKLTAVVEDNHRQPQVIEGLEIVFVDNEVEPESRALHFFVGLPNAIVHKSESSDGHRFLTWRYKPGQRMQLRVPVEQWADRIVLPIDAVANEGAEHYVFQQNGDHFDRVPVHVEYQDQLWTVIDNDGSIFPGDTVATSGAHQLQMALKNKAGGGVDPHAGHTH